MCRICNQSSRDFSLTVNALVLFVSVSVSLTRRSVALKSEIRKLNIVHLLIWVLMVAQVTANL